MKPPSIYMVTPSGRFEVNMKICMSMSDFHPESWNPSWRVETILVGETFRYSGTSQNEEFGAYKVFGFLDLKTFYEFKQYFFIFFYKAYEFYLNFFGFINNLKALLGCHRGVLLLYEGFSFFCIYCIILNSTCCLLRDLRPY